MPADTIPFHPEPSSAATPALSPLEKLLNDIDELHQITGLSIRHLRRLDSCRDIPGRVVSGRRVLFQTEIIREWVRAGLPNAGRWAALQKRTGNR